MYVQVLDASDILVNGGRCGFGLFGYLTGSYDGPGDGGHFEEITAGN
jgi:hypothetical protein